VLTCRACCVVAAALCKQALRKKDRVKIFVKGKDRFWIENMQSPNQKGVNQVCGPLCAQAK